MLAVEKGKGIIIVTIALMLAFDLITITLNAIKDGIFIGAVRFLLECILFYFLFKGHNWARWLTGVLLIMGAGIYLLHFNVFSLVLMIFYLIFGIALLASKDVNAYIDFKRNRLDLDTMKDDDYSN